METPINMDAVRLLSRTWARSMLSWGPIFSFREAAAAGFASAKSELFKKHLSDTLVYDGMEELNDIVINKNGSRGGMEEIYKAAGGRDKVAEKSTETALANFYYSVDAASLVFAHAIVDNLVNDYCRVTAIAAPESWMPIVGNKKYSLEEMSSSSFEDLYRKRTDKYFAEELPGTKLMFRMKTLHDLCNASLLPASDSGYSYDRERLARLDANRHRIAHGSKLNKALPNGEDDLRFMQSTILHYIPRLVGYSFHLRLDYLVTTAEFERLVKEHADDEE